MPFIPLQIFIAVAGLGAAGSRLKEREAKAISHRRCEFAGVEVKVKRRRGDGITPVTGMRKRERSEPSLVARVGG